MDRDAEGTHADKILLQLNWRGWFQLVHFVLLEIGCLTLVGQSLSTIFLGRNVEHQCARTAQENQSWTEEMYTDYNVTYGTCTVDFVNGSKVIESMPCPDGYHYPFGSHQSFTAEWDLVCGQAFLSDLSQTLLSCGQTLGAFIFSPLSDRFGRKPVYTLCGMSLCVTLLISAFSPNYSFFIATRFIAGALLQGLTLSSLTAFIELLPTKQRGLAAKVDSFCFAFSNLVVTAFAYLTQWIHWRYSALILASFASYTFILWCTLSESLRWLLAQGKLDKAELVIRKAARWNRTDVDKVLELLHSGGNETESIAINVEQCNSETKTNPKELSECVSPSSPSKSDNLSYSILWRNRRMLKCLLILCYAMFADSIMFYGLVMMSENLTDDLYLGLFLNCIVEIPSAITICVVLNRLGRRKSSMCFLGLGSAAMLVSVIFSMDFADSMAGQTTVMTIMPLIGKYAVNTTFGIMFFYTPEVFPTTLRNMACGTTIIFARIGSMLAPFSRVFARHVRWGPGAVFAALSLSAVVCLGFLPDTDHREIPQTVEDFDRLFQKEDDNGNRKHSRRRNFKGCFSKTCTDEKSTEMRL